MPEACNASDVEPVDGINGKLLPVTSFAPARSTPQKPLHFITARFRMLTADAVARDFARKLVQIERQLQSFFASHGTTFLNLCASVARGVMKGFYCALNAGAHFLHQRDDFCPMRSCSIAETASAATHSFTITDVPSRAALKKCSAIPLGNRMQPCDAAYGGT